MTLRARFELGRSAAAGQQKHFSLLLWTLEKPGGLGLYFNSIIACPCWSFFSSEKPGAVSGKLQAGLLFACMALSVSEQHVPVLS